MHQYRCSIINAINGSLSADRRCLTIVHLSEFHSRSSRIFLPHSVNNGFARKTHIPCPFRFSLYLPMYGAVKQSFDLPQCSHIVGSPFMSLEVGLDANPTLIQSSKQDWHKLTYITIFSIRSQQRVPISHFQHLFQRKLLTGLCVHSSEIQISTIDTLGLLILRMDSKG